MQSMNLFAVEESTDLWNEVYNWIYAVDKNHQPTDEPEDAFNHLIDCWRYVITDYKGVQNNSLKKPTRVFPIKTTTMTLPQLLLLMETDMNRCVLFCEKHALIPNVYDNIKLH
jgi:hypothetical protein